jgi:para-nitrobenzyl esterase
MRYTDRDEAVALLSRRAVLGAGGLALGSLLAPGMAFGQLDTPASEPAFVVAETTSGRIRGFNVSPIKTFKGVPYGAPTGGRNRYMPARPPAPWSGVRDTMADGTRSPQPIRRPEDEYTQMIDWDRNPGAMGEDCLSLNVWTPGLRDGARRPVLVHFHGGGWTQGSGGGLLFNGGALARFGDVVVVSPNHRLGAFGYLNLVDLGAPAEFRHAGVAGVTDLLLVLRWVRDNAEAFGGDPNTVMVFGQSGGGSKTSVTMTAPGAKGLFHRAIVQSGSAVRLTEREQAARAASLLLADLGIPRSRIADIRNVPMDKLLDAQRRVSERNPGVGFAPVVDGEIIPHHPFDPTAPAASAHVPMIIGTTLDDGGLREKNFDLTEAQLRAYAEEQAPGQGERIYRAYRSAYPNATPYLVRVRMMTDRNHRTRATLQAERKAQQAAQGGAPVWMYRFDWPSPAFGGKFGSVHGTEVPLQFHDTRSLIVGNNPEAKKLADVMAGTWVAFARTGDPNHGLIPRWAPYDLQSRTTMVFNVESRVVNDPDGHLRRLWADVGRTA